MICSVSRLRDSQVLGLWLLNLAISFLQCIFLQYVSEHEWRGFAEVVTWIAQPVDLGWNVKFVVF